MCGIAGYIRLDRHHKDSIKQAIAEEHLVEETNMLQNMLQKLEHRGPDHQAYWIGDHIGLAHTRLKILDLSDKANQPFFSEDGQQVLVFNGEIYNHLFLRSKLQFKNFQTHSDTETLLYALVEFGEKIIPELNGIFSFAYYDFRKQKLLLARDRFGVKPLYYHHSKNAFYFASEISPLLLIPEINDDMDSQALEEYEAMLAAQGNRTLYKNIKKLLPAHSLSISLEEPRPQEKTFWKIPTQRSYLKELPQKIISDVEMLLIASIKRQVYADAPLGFFLSGGLDSSLLVAIAQRHAHIQKPQCFTILQDTAKYGFENDYGFAQKLAKNKNWDLECVSKPLLELKHIDEILEIIEEPIPDLSAVNVAAISKEAHKKGVKVLISGLGADDVFTGYRRHLLASYHPYLKLIPWKLLNLFIKVLASKQSPMFRRLQKVTDAWDSDKDQFLLKLLLYNYNRDTDLSCLGKFLASFEEEITTIDKALALEQISYLPQQNLLYTDKVSMHYGVEVRVPYLDHELTEYIYNIPANLKLRGFQTKYILKQIALKYLPKEVVYRKKVGFSEPISTELLLQLKKAMQDGNKLDHHMNAQAWLNTYACHYFTNKKNKPNSFNCI